MPNQSQKHGFQFENIIKIDIFDLPEENNNIDKYDIPKSKNKFNSNENISIKFIKKGGALCLGDIIHINNYDLNDKNTLVLGIYLQIGNNKKLVKLIEVNYNKELYDYLFGNLPKNEIKKYVEGVKSIPNKVKGKQAMEIFPYLDKKKELKEKYKFKIDINPKVDSQQSRVQCSILNFEKTLEKFISYSQDANDEGDIFYRGKKINVCIKSPSRIRGGIKKYHYLQLCKVNKISGYSKLRKDQLISLLKQNGIIKTLVICKNKNNYIK